MRKTGLLLTLFGLLGILSFAPTTAHAQATRTWVSGVGDDANPCSRTAPCKTWAGAISKTAAGGEIDCLDPGGFGNVTITKSMTIDCGTFPGGDLNAGGVNGIIVNAGTSDKVVLRNVVVQGTIGTSPGLNGIRFIGGLELHLDRVVVQGQTNFCVDVTKTALGTLFVRNSYFTECASGVVLNSTTFVFAQIENSTFSGMGGNGVAATTASATANVAGSTFQNIGTNCMVATVSGATVNASNNVLMNCGGSGISAAVSGANITANGNSILGATTSAFNVAAGGTFLSGNDNKISAATSAGSNKTGDMGIR
jgi:hypothetical protein